MSILHTVKRLTAYTRVCSQHVELHLNCLRRTNHRLYSRIADCSVHSKPAGESDSLLDLPEVQFDWEYLNDQNIEDIRRNIKNRKDVGDIDRVLSLKKSLEGVDKTSAEYVSVKQQLMNAVYDIPNKTHPQSPIGDESCAREVHVCGNQRDFSFKPKTAVEIGHRLNMLRTQFVGHTTGPRTYFFEDDLARMEEALVRYTLDTLLQKYKFTLVSVPVMLHPAIIEACGFKTSGKRSQVYRLDHKVDDDVCLAATGEFPIAGFFFNECLDEDELPKRIATCSRCFRAETADISRERGLYRVHQFTKVEMFSVTTNETSCESDEALSDFINIEQYLFEQLGLHFRVLDMPSQELGASAYRKYDMEAWLPGKEFWGEVRLSFLARHISSASNCTDFQSRRLGITYRTRHGNIKHCHTVNGTACAIPRLMIAILENYQQPNGTVVIPDILQPYMDDQKVISKRSSPINVTFSSLKKAQTAERDRRVQAGVQCEEKQHGRHYTE